MNPFRRVWHVIYGTWFICVFGTAAVLTTGLLIVTPGENRRRFITRQSARAVFGLTFAAPRISGLENMPGHAAIVVANHASYLDGILLTAVLPHDYQFVIKREITSVPGVHFFLRRIGAHFVERFDPRRGATDARRIMQNATQGASLAFFPEGTFRREPGLRRFQNGAFIIAMRQKLPLIPLTIRGTRTMLPAEAWLPRPARLEIIIDEPLRTEHVNDAFEARDLCRQRILTQLDEPDLVSLEPVTVVAEQGMSV